MAVTRPLEDLDRDEVSTSRSEKLLAAVLAGFVLIGVLWVYYELDNLGGSRPPAYYYSNADAPLVLGSRLLWVGGVLAFGYFLMSRLRSRNSRFQTAALAVAGAGAVQVLVMAVDYADEYLDVDRYGALLISMTGVALTLAALAGVHRYATRRLPLRRGRRGECPFCGWPARGPNCEGCGRIIASECSTCGHERLVGVPHCRACGAP